MALAFLSYKGPHGANQNFTADTGSNRFYQYKIGKKKRRFGGLETIDDITYQSALISVARPGDAAFRTAFEFSVSGSHFDPRAKYIQLFSYRDRAGSAPAVSPVIRVLPSVGKTIFSIAKTSMEPDHIGHKAFCYKEVPVSRAMFWDSILKAAPKILEVAGPLVKGILGKKGNGSAQPKNGSDKDAIIQAILEVINAISQKQETAPASAAASMSLPYPARPSLSMAINPALLAQLGPVIEKVASPETIEAVGNQPVKLLKVIGEGLLKMDQQEIEHLERLNPGVKDSTVVPILQSMSHSRSPQYAYAHIAPAVLAALPALAPLIEKLVDPKTIEAIGNQPVKLLKAISDGVLAADKQEMEHLERLPL